jgi:hypothetical protein
MIKIRGFYPILDQLPQKPYYRLFILQTVNKYSIDIYTLLIIIIYIKFRFGIDHSTERIIKYAYPNETFQILS